MKKMIVGFACMLTVLPASRSWSDEYQVTARMVAVRNSPDEKALIRGYIPKGAIVTGEPKGDWVKAQFGKGDGYIFFRNLKKMEVASALLQEKRANMGSVNSTRAMESAKDVQPQANLNIAPIVQNQKLKEVKLVIIPQEQQTPSGNGNEAKKEKENVVAEDVALLEKERNDLGRRLLASINENKKLKDELERIRAAVDAQGFDQLLAAADNGDQVFIKGVGEVLLATAFGKTVVRVPMKAATRADGIFSAAMAERVPVKGYIYYICDTRMLQFNRS